MSDSGSADTPPLTGGRLRVAVGRAFALATCLAAAAAATGPAAPAEPLVPPVAHDPGVPSPARFLGYDVGDGMTDHVATIAYLRACEASSRRIQVRTYGETHEGRDLVYVVISHPDNLARLESIRENIRALSDPGVLAQERAEVILNDTPVVVWLSYGVHGNEHSSTEAALVTAWHLASAQDAATLEQLRRTVVILDPMQNPDGRERFLAYQRQVAGRAPRPDPDAAEHDEPWPGGRYNHLLFDLNRDWFYQTQPETRGRIQAYLSWMPQVHVDLHEMSPDSTYYFPPPAAPVNANTPASIPAWWEIFGHANAAAFDRAGFDYYTAESFDGYYPGYGDSWPTFHGAVGMTYEQATVRGYRYRRRDGTELTLREAVRRHATASLSTIATAADHREELLRDFLRSRREAIEAGRESPTRTWVITRRVSDAARRLASLLTAQGVDVERARGPFTLRARSWDEEEARSTRFEEGTWIVRASQPAGHMVTALMEQDPSLSDVFVGEEMERRRLREPSAIYDVTAWSLPLLTGADVRWSPDRVRVATDRVEPDDLAPRGGLVRLRGARERDATPAGAPYAWIVGYDDNAALRAVIALLVEGIPLKLAGRPFRIGDRRFPAGSVVVRARDDVVSLRARVEAVAKRVGALVHEVDTGLTDEGPDLGSNHVVPLALPRVAVAYGPPTSPPSLGAVMQVLEQDYSFPFTPVRVTRLAVADLSRYDVIVLPDARGSYDGSFGEEGVGRLKGWIEAGGTLITIGRATAWVADEEVGIASIRRQRLPSEPKQDHGSDEDPSDGDWPDPIRGAILRVVIEPSRPEAFGYPHEGAVMVNSDLVFSHSKKGREIVTFAPVESIRVAGFAFEESLALAAGSPYLVEESLGRGRVILFTDDPNFRGYWESLNRLFLNGILYARAFDSGD